MTTSVNLVGNLTREPELRYTGGGQPVASFGLAVNRRVQNKQTNDWQDQTSFFDVTCFGTLAENVAGSLPKGARAVVTGRLDQRTWDDKDGGKRSKVEVVADEVGPSLRWATADITKNERRAGGDSGDDGRPF
jgi:single-strand DNA-binding protein